MSEKHTIDTSPSAAAAGPPNSKKVSSAAPVGASTGQESSGSSGQGAPDGDTVNGGTGTFGSRMLSSDRNVFEHNAWDHVEPDDDHRMYAEGQIRLHREYPVPEEERERYNDRPAEFWDSFYEINKDKFFKDRHWLRVEFAEMFQWTDKRKSTTAAACAASKDNDSIIAEAAAATAEKETVPETRSEKFRIMEVGCGAGNTVFPLLNDIYDPRLFVYACDYSKTAVDVVKLNEAYNEDRCSAFAWDLSSTELPPQVEPESVDILLMIFVFSALHPDQWSQAVDNAYKLVKPGGVILFRDYGRNDLAQLRFKKSRLLAENFYIRGDGTRVYFFTNEELATLFGKRFVVEQNAIDRRLIVNRKRELKMYRVWLQAKFRKPIDH
ncbi:hypothetical protein LPJ59_002563 [Coemansia sp. RSA 2399]|nr:hypothetical protein LPJ59_002563 [Coemansia sp. RSA 2399]